MTDKEQWIEFWLPSLGSLERCEQEWAIKIERERNPIRSASVYVMPAYQSPVTGKWIDTPSQRRDDLKRTGSRPWEGREQETKEAAKRAADVDRDMDRLSEKIAVEAWQQLPEQHRAALS
jgi:hypothetical protein